MSTDPRPPLVMLGAADAAVCEDDSCLLPGAATLDKSEATTSDNAVPTPGSDDDSAS